MASLKKRGKTYSIVFKTREDGKQITKTYALGTPYKKIAEHKKVEYEKLYQRGEINHFDDSWSVREYEKSQQESSKPAVVDSYYLEDLKKDFLKFKSHVSQPTKKGYRSVINLFIEHVGRSMTAPLIKASDIRTFCLKPGYANATQRNYLRHLKAFFNWMKNKEIISKNPCNDVKPPKKKDKLVEKIFDEETLHDIISAFRKYQLKHKKSGAITHDSQKQHWFKPLITTAYYTGLRRKELVQLRWEYVNLNKREIHVTDTKNGKERTVIIFDQAYDRLRAWHKINGYPNKGLVFPSPRSTKKLEIALTGNNVSKVFKSYVNEAKVKDTIHFHCLRHSCATYMIRQGFDVTMVKEMLGHKSIEVTMRYVNLVVKDRKDRAIKLGLITKN
jgi:site-specific recombinase XerD